MYLSHQYMFVIAFINLFTHPVLTRCSMHYFLPFSYLSGN